ncbi:MAG: hypothetical protein GX851_05950, partial [Clostridiales bacterium]|nr:hypothetical protein [Clostridiales bacterium]
VEELAKNEVLESEGIEYKIGKAPAYMNRSFCSTRDRIAYILQTSVGTLGLGKYDVSSDYYLYKILALQPSALPKAKIGLGKYNMVNNPPSAAIIDNMRSRWGKFKPFQYLSIIPSFAVGLITCLLPMIFTAGGFGDTKKLWIYMALSYLGETIGAFFGGGGYIDNVFTPNPNERTALLTVSKFFSGSKFPEQVAGIIIDLVDNGKLDLSIVKAYVIMKTAWWLISVLPNIYWTIVSRERVPQSEKPPNPIHGILSVFKNIPLLVYTLSGAVDGIDIGTSETLYYSEVLHFTMLPTIAGIPGSPISYASYAVAPKLRRRFSTKSLWMMQRGSIVASEGAFFFVGCIGGREHGLYKRVAPMLVTFMLGNCLEMFFYATKKIVGAEINYEVLDYCEWKNGYRVEATINLLTGYFGKVRGIFLNLINAWLLERWAGFETGIGIEQTPEAKWKMFLAAHGPHLVFDIISLLPMLLYNIDKHTRDKMYADLERTRAETAIKATVTKTQENTPPDEQP